MLKKFLAFAAALAMMSCVMSAAAYRLTDFTPYTHPINLTVNETAPKETKDGIQFTSDKDLFACTQPGVTLNAPVTVNGFTVVYRIDSWDGDKDMYPAVCIGFTEEKGMITWNCEMDGTGKGGFMLQHRFPNPEKDPDTFEPYFEFNTIVVGRNIRRLGNSQQVKDAGPGKTVTMKFVNDDKLGYVVYVNGTPLVGAENTTADLKAFRQIADKNGGKMYFNACAQLQELFGEKIAMTVMFINGQKVSSIQTNSPPKTDTSSGVTDESKKPDKSSKAGGSKSTNSQADVSDNSASEQSGTSLSDESALDTSSEPAPSAAGTESGVPAGEDKGPSSALIVLIVVIAVVILGGGAAAFIILKKQH